MISAGENPTLRVFQVDRDKNSSTVYVASESPTSSQNLKIVDTDRNGDIDYVGSFDGYTRMDPPDNSYQTAFVRGMIGSNVLRNSLEAAIKQNRLVIVRDPILYRSKVYFTDNASAKIFITPYLEHETSDPKSRCVLGVGLEKTDSGGNVTMAVMIGSGLLGSTIYDAIRGLPNISWGWCD